MTSSVHDAAAELFTPAEETAMRTALRAAERGVRGANPVVGAVVLSASGEILHVGHHRGAGTPHAEADALRAARQAGTDLRDTTMVVTLEPCHHTGRTGPCSREILRAGVPRVVFAVGDGTATASGGAAALAQHGVQVRAGLLAGEARELNERWFLAQEQERPFVTLKIAQSLDGRVAATDGTSQWITGETARSQGHALRSRVDAILVGGGTLRTDDPSLTARDAAGAPLPRQPLRAVLSRRPVPAGARVRRGVVVEARDHDVVAPRPGHGPAAGAGESDDGRFVHLDTHDPREALSRLSALGVAHVLVEGGPTVAAAFLASDLVDDLWLYQAPVLLGAGAASVGDLGIGTLAAASRWRGDPVGVPDGQAVAPAGEDLRWHLRPAPATPAAGLARTVAPAGRAAPSAWSGTAPASRSGPAGAQETTTNSPDDPSSTP